MEGEALRDLFCNDDLVPLALKIDVLWNDTFGKDNTLFYTADSQENQPLPIEIEKEEEEEEEESDLPATGPLVYELNDEIGLMEEEDEIIDLSGPESERENAPKIPLHTVLVDPLQRQKKEENALLKRVFARMEAVKGRYSIPPPRVEEFLDETRSKSYKYDLRTYISNPPISMIGSKLHKNVKKRQRDPHWETEILLNKYVKRPAWRIPFLVNKNYEDSHYDAPSMKYVRREEEAYEVAPVALQIEKRNAKSKVRTEICENNCRVPPRHLFGNHHAECAKVGHSTNRFLYDRYPKYHHTDASLAYSGFERICLFNLPMMYHKMIQFQQYQTDQQRIPENILASYLNLDDTKAFYNNALSLQPKSIEHLRVFSEVFRDWLKIEGKSTHCATLLQRLKHYSLSGKVLKTREVVVVRQNVDSSSPAKILLGTLFPDILEDPAELDPLDGYDENISPLEPESCIEQDALGVLSTFPEGQPMETEESQKNVPKDPAVDELPFDIEQEILDSLEGFEEGEKTFPKESKKISVEGEPKWGIYDSGSEIEDIQTNNESLKEEEEEEEEEEEVVIEESPVPEEQFCFPAEAVNNIHPFMRARPTDRAHGVPRLLYGWSDYSVDVLDGMEHVLRRYIYKVIGKAVLLYRERMKYQPEKGFLHHLSSKDIQQAVNYFQTNKTPEFFEVPNKYFEPNNQK